MYQVGIPMALDRPVHAPEAANGKTARAVAAPAALRSAVHSEPEQSFTPNLRRVRQGQGLEHFGQLMQGTLNIVMFRHFGEGEASSSGNPPPANDGPGLPVELRATGSLKGDCSPGKAKQLSFRLNVYHPTKRAILHRSDSLVLLCQTAEKNEAERVLAGLRRSTQGPCLRRRHRRACISARSAGTWQGKLDRDSESALPQDLVSSFAGSRLGES